MRSDWPATWRAAETLVVSYFSAIVDGNDHAYLDGYLDALRPVLGIRIDEFAPLASAGPGPCSIAVHSDRLGAFEGTIWSELVELQGAEVVAQFAESDLAGRPAVTRNDHGAGHAWYVATQPQPSALDAIIAAALGEAGVAPAIARLPEGVEAQRRGDYLFLINQGVVDIDTSIGGRHPHRSVAKNPHSRPAPDCGVGSSRIEQEAPQSRSWNHGPIRIRRMQSSQPMEIQRAARIDPARTRLAATLREAGAGHVDADQPRDRGSASSMNGDNQPGWRR
jgi:hypothetical protein